jgi:prolyl-tRNA synthetase
MFADMDLIGVPHRIVVGERGLKSGEVEYKGRTEDKASQVPLANLMEFMRARVG